MTQKQRIAAWLEQHGSITNKEAFDELGIARLAARIAELIDEGVSIIKETECSRNRYGQKVRYTRYKKAV